MLVTQTDLPLRLLRRGKVRDVYEVDDGSVLLVATDRVSAFDVVMAEPIPHKGMVLTQITAWWLGLLGERVNHHMLSVDVDEIIQRVPQLAPHSAILAGRSTLCRRAEVFPVECVLRGYITGSAWKEYAASGTLAGEPLPAGLRESEKLPVPVFSPATKAEEGHDENITVSRMRSIIGAGPAAELERLTRTVYAIGGEVALESGIIIADTKLEFGYLGSAAGESFDPSRVILVDEVLTPDSSRFWPADRFEPGRPQQSFDKQPLRDYLDAERKRGNWNGEAPAPPLPEEVVEATSERYLEIFRRLTHSSLDTGATH
jgi:phosphoribosylaminoimidazole-succinocarboxamide synthase